MQRLFSGPFQKVIGCEGTRYNMQWSIWQFRMFQAHDVEITALSSQLEDEQNMTGHHFIIRMKQYDDDEDEDIQ